MNIKEYFKKVLKIPKMLFKRFPVSISISVISSILIAIFLENDILHDIFYFLLFLGIGSLFVEIMADKSKRFMRYPGYFLSLVIAVIFNKYIIEQNQLVIKFAVIYGITLYILGLLKLFKDSKLSINEYVTRIASTSFKVQVVSSILSMGILLVAGIIITLFSASDLLIVRLELLFGGTFVLPALIYTFAETKEKVWDFIKFAIKNLLSVILLASFAVIYIYMLKILVTLKVPSNHIFRIVSILFVLGLPTWTMIDSFKEKNIIGKINSKLPLIFIPLFFVQIYSLIVRIVNNGITISRYVGICLLILELCYLIIYIIKKEKVYLAAYAVIILSVIGILLPKINAVDLTINTQFKRLIYYLNKNELSNKERRSMYDTYSYLIDLKDGRSLIHSKLTNEQIEYITEEKYIDYECFFSTFIDDDPIDINGYKMFKTISLESLNIKETFSTLENLNINNHPVDLTKLFSDFIKSKNPDDYLKNHHIIERDNYKIIITYLDICLEENMVQSYAINGYILEK